MPRSQTRTATRRLRPAPATVERIQTGVRIEKHLLKVLKAIAEYQEITLGDLIEGIVLHAFDGKPAFDAASLQHIREFRRMYGLHLDASHSHRLVEAPPSPVGRRSPRSPR